MELKKICEKLKEHFFANDNFINFDVIEKIEKHIKASLPADYKYFLQWFSNGGETDEPFPYLKLLSAEETLEYQSDYEVDKWGPNLLVFATDGDDAFFFNLNTNKSTCDYQIVKISLSGRNIDDAENVASSFQKFLGNLLLEEG